jgi:hypothetical protein
MAMTRSEKRELIGELKSIFEEEVRRELKELERRMQTAIDKKQDVKIADVEKRTISEGTQRISIRAKEAISKAEEAMRMANSPHACSQRDSIASITDDVRDIRKVLYGNRGLKIGAVISVILALFTGAAFIFNIKTETAVTKSQVIDMKQDVVALQEDSRRLKDTIEKNNETGDERYRQILFNLQSIDTQMKTNSQPSTRYKRRDKK